MNLTIKNVKTSVKVNPIITKISFAFILSWLNKQSKLVGVAELQLYGDFRELEGHFILHTKFSFPRENIFRPLAHGLSGVR